MLRALSAMARAVMPLAALVLGELAAPALAQERPVILVGTFADPSETGAAKELRQQLYIALAQTNRLTPVFRIPEPTYEKNSTDPDAQQRQQREPGYVMEGSINFAERRPDPSAATLAAIMPGLCPADRYTLSIDTVVSSLRTSEVAFARNLQVSVKVPCSVPDTAPAMQEVITRIAQMTVRDLVTSVYPINVVGTQPDGAFLLDFGMGVLPVGTYLLLYGADETITADGRTLTISGPLLGRVRVTKAGPETAEAAREGTGKIKLTPGAVARIDDDQSATKKPKGRKP